MNEKYIEILEKLAMLTHAKGEFFKEKAYKRAAEEMYLFDHEIKDIDKLKGIYGFGHAIITKLKEFQKTGKVSYLENSDDLMLLELTQIHGIGNKKAKELIEKHKIKSIEELKKKKELLNAKQLLGLKYYEDIKKKIPREEIQEYEKQFRLNIVAGTQMEIVGSYRRGKTSSGDIDVILSHKGNDRSVYTEFIKNITASNILIEKLSSGKIKTMGIIQLPSKPARRLDILYSPPDEYAFAILYFTGSKMFNIGTRRHALSMGLSLNEHGLTEVKTKKKLELKMTNEKDIFSFLGLQYVEPSKRIGIKDVVKLKKRKRCPRGTRMNKKSGECEKVKLKLIKPKKIKLLPPKTIKRCPKGERMNKKTGKCEKKEPKTKTIKKSKKMEKEHRLMKFKEIGISYLSSIGESELAEIIRHATKLYHNEKPALTDIEYDILKEYMEREYPDNDVHSDIGAPLPKAARNKTTLPYKMFSMNKIKPDTTALRTWRKKYSGPYVISCKLDGVSGLFTTENKEKKLYTRGNGIVGQDVSNIIPYLNLPETEDIVIRGEFIIPKVIYSKKYPDTNARNIVSGIINSKKQVVSKYQDMRFVAYELIKPELKPSEQLKYLETIGANVVRYEETKDITNENLSHYLQSWRDDYDYDIDGIIVTHDKVHPRKDKNPEHAFAFKMLLGDQVSEAKVVDVRWVVSKDGLLKPTIEIEPIKILGTTIQYATAHNADFIEKNKLGPGAMILLSKSGDVIPKIVKVITPAEKAKMPDVPYTWNKTHKEIIVESPDSDPDVKRRNIIHFFEKLNIPGMKEKTILKVLEKHPDAEVETIVKMTKEQLLELPGIKDKTATKIHEGIQSALKTASIGLMVAASNIFGAGIGERITKNVISGYSEFFTTKDSDSLVKTKLEKIDGLGEITIQKLLSGKASFIAFAESIGYTIPKQSKATIQSTEVKKAFVITGPRDKTVITKLESLGGELVKGVSKTTHMVLAEDPTSNSGTIIKAKKYGIPVVSFEEFLKM